MPPRHRVEPQFIAQRGTKATVEESFAATRAKTSITGEILSPEDAVPDVFDEPRIRADLERLSSAPSFFARYFVALSSRFHRHSEVEALERWRRVYAKSKELADAIRALQTTQNEHALRVSELQAQTEENRLRRDKARSERKTLLMRTDSPAPTLPKTDDEVHFDRKRSRRYLDVLDQILEDFELKVKNDVEVLKAKKRWRREILTDKELSAEEQEDLMDRVDAHFRNMGKSGDGDMSIFAKE